MTDGIASQAQQVADQFLGGKPEEIEAWVQRTRSPLGQDALATLAWGTPTKFGDSLPAATQQRGSALTAPWGAALARTTAFADQSEPGWRRAQAILDSLASRPGKLDPQSASLLAQIMFRLGEVSELAALLPQLDLDDEASWTTRADLANPFHSLASATSTETGWLSVINERFSEGIAPLRLRPANTGSAYTRLAAENTGTTQGDLVSVVMSAYSPARDDLLCAVQAVLDQSWAALELLIIDDASPAGSEELLAEVAALDDRVRVIRAPQNAGTYAARNLAMSHARGRYLTFHDSDDWAHPERISTQVRALSDNPGLLATRTWTLRAYEDLTMTYVGYTPSRLNASSLLFERGPVEALIGQFDGVRKSGDMEYPLRLKAVRPGSVRDLKTPFPMAITQLRSGSLSRTDATPGWTRWDRIRYRDFYLHWHQGIKAGRDEARLPTTSGDRPFPLPQPSWAPTREAAAQEPARYEVCVVADFSRTHLDSGLGTALADFAQSINKTTAVAHVEGPDSVGPRRAPLNGSLVHSLRANLVTLTDGERQDSIGTLIVTDPSLLSHWAQPRLRPDRVLLWADSRKPSGDVWRRAARLVHELWGLSPKWLASSKQTQEALARTLPGASIHSQLVAPVVPSTPSTACKPRRDGHPWVGGHHLPDKRAFWPRDTRLVRESYPAQPGVDFHFLAGLGTATRDLGHRPPPHWLSLAQHGMSTTEFLYHLDFFCYQGPWNMAGQIAVLQAISAGLPVIAPEEAGKDIPSPLLLGETSALLPALGPDRVAALNENLRTAQDQVQMRRSIWIGLLNESPSSSLGD